MQTARARSYCVSLPLLLLVATRALAATPPDTDEAAARTAAIERQLPPANSAAAEDETGEHADPNRPLSHAALTFSRCAVEPLPHDQVALRIDGVERTRWHFGSDAPRPFFYPFRGPSGATLTRMGHPGAANHDHHRSIWLGHKDVDGVDFWSDQTEGRIRQQSWYAYQDGPDEAVMAVAIGWYDGRARQIMKQDLIAALLRLPGGEDALEIQITLRPPGGTAAVQLGKTNFGLLAVRVAKTMSAYFGGGQLTGSNGQQGEAALFGKPAKWLDYSGPVAVGRGPKRRAVMEGITFFDHPDNPRYPTPWHVREDGWMGASLCMHEGLTISAGKPLTLRYLLHAHAGDYDRAKAEVVQNAFARRAGFQVTKATTRHRQYEVRRKIRGPGPR